MGKKSFTVLVILTTFTFLAACGPTEQGVTPTSQAATETSYTAIETPEPTNTREPTPSQTPSPTEIPQPSGVLFRDDFSNPSSGWDRCDDDVGITDYHDGAYRIIVNTLHTDAWCNPGLNFTDTIIMVEARKVGGPDDNDYGIICRYQDPFNFYYFIISSDGYYGIAKVVNGESELIGGQNLAYSVAIKQGNSTNKLRADCVGEKLVLYANRQLLMGTTDSQFSSGDVGLLAGTFDAAGTEILFDNFVVRAP